MDCYNDFSGRFEGNNYYFCQPEGEMAEWSNAAVSKTVVRLPANRGFESPSLRNAKANHPDRGGMVFCFQTGRSELVLLRSG